MKVQIFLNIDESRRFVGMLASNRLGIAFQYSDEFIKTKLEISPLSIPLQKGIWRSQSMVFDGLPGFAADSLPDGWGNLLLHRQLTRIGERLDAVDPLRRLCWVGRQGMGALEYEPEEKFRMDFHPDDIRLDTLANHAEEILNDREAGQALDELASLNGSSGGARPKIVCLVSPDKRVLRPGSTYFCQGDVGEPWLIKFRSSADSIESGALEYAVSLLAKRAGIDMPETHLFFSEKGPGWYGIKRFDRTESGKLHMATAAGLLHCNFREPCLDYRTLMALTQRLSGACDLLEMLRRAYFNFVIDNRDDHAKNFSFVMNGAGEWRVAPAYDLVPVTGGFEHMTALMGDGKRPPRKAFLQLATAFGIASRKAEEALARVDDSLGGWQQLAKACGVKKPPVFEPIR